MLISGSAVLFASFFATGCLSRSPSLVLYTVVEEGQRRGRRRGKKCNRGRRRATATATATADSALSSLVQ